MFSEAPVSDEQPDSHGARYVHNVRHGAVSPRRLRYRRLFGAQRGGTAGVFRGVLPRCFARVQKCWQSGSIQGELQLRTTPKRKRLRSV